MRLVDDQRTMRRQRGAAVQRVDRQQGVIGHDQVCRSCSIPRLLDEAFVSVGAALSSQTFPNRDGNLLPAPFSMRRSGITVRQSICGRLLLRPLAQREDLRAERGFWRARRGRWNGADQISGRKQGALMSGRRVSYPQKACVVRSAFDNRVHRPVAGDLLDGVQRHGNVLVSELALQCQRGSGYDNPLSWVLLEPAQRRHQVTERLSGTRSGLDEKVYARIERVGDRIGHPRLARPFHAADRLHGRRQRPAVRNFPRGAPIDVRRIRPKVSGHLPQPNSPACASHAARRGPALCYELLRCAAATS